MHIVVVHIHVKPESIDAFKAATLDNASNSYQEPGVARFDAIQQQDDPTQFTLIEVYHTEEAIAAHKETDHYLRWRQTVENMMAAKRVGIRYTNVYPGDDGW